MIGAIGIEAPRAAGIAVAIGVHGVILAAGLWASSTAVNTEPEAIKIALATVAPEPEEENTPAPEPLPEPEPVPEPEPLPTPPDPEPAPRPDPAPDPVPTPPQPEPTPQPIQETVLASSAAPEVGETMAAAAPAPSKAPPPPDARTQARQATYFGQILAWLDRHKRYPRDARRNREEGVSELFIAIDRNGRVREYRLVASSGNQMLDDASLAMVRRADPLPSMPKHIPGDGMEFVVPVEFFMKEGRR